MKICIYYLVLEMANDRKAMYDGFSKKSGHSAEWVRIVHILHGYHELIFEWKANAYLDREHAKYCEGKIDD
jgi:hypothetical protein